MERTEGELRPGAWLPAVAAGLAGLAVFAYLSVELSFALLDLARFIGVALVLILPVGWLTLYPFQTPAEPRLARLGLALLMGYPVTLTIYFGLGLLRLEPVYPVLILLAVGLCLFLVARQGRAWLSRARAIGRTVLVGLRDIDAGGVFVFLLALLIVLPWLRYLIPRGGDYADVTYHDAFTNVALVQEMFRGVPPRQYPSAAGEPYVQYHMFHHLFVMLTARYSGLDVLPVFFVFVPILLTGLIVLGLCLTVGCLFTNRAIGWVAAGAVYVLGPVLEDLLTRLFHIGGPAIRFIYYTSPHGLGGFTVVVGIFACLALAHRLGADQTRTAGQAHLLYLAGFLAAVLYVFKAHFFALLFPAFLAGLAVLWLRDREARVLWSMACALLAFGLLRFAWPAPSEARLVVQFGRYAQANLLGAAQLLAPGEPRYELIRRFMLGPEGQPSWLALLTLTVIAYARSVHLSPLLPAYAYNRARAFRRLGHWETVLGVMFPAALASVLFLDAAQLGSPGKGHLGDVQLALISLVSLALNGSLIAGLGFAGAGHRLKPAHLAAAALFVLALATPLAGWVTRRWAGGEGSLISGQVVAALQYLEREAPPDAVIASELNGEFVAALSGRRVMSGRYDARFPGRREAMVQLFSTLDPVKARAILRQYQVTHLIENEDSPVHFETEGALRLAYDAGSVRVYQVALP